MASSSGEEVVTAACSPAVVYRRYDDGYIVRSMTPQDALIVQKWWSTYIISRYDLDVALSSFPADLRGFYIGEYNGQVVASVVRLPWGDDVCYGSYYYVEKAFRSRGFGTRLRDEVAREHVGTRRLCVDAVAGKVAKDNEEKFGYRPKFKSARYSAVAKANYPSVNTTATIGSIDLVSFDSLIAYDNKCFVSSDFGPRRNFLRQWTRVAGGATLVALDGVTGEIVGYVCRRPAIQPAWHEIGPLYADGPEIAEALLREICSGVAGDEVIIHILYPHKTALQLVTKFEFKVVFDLERMELNGSTNEDVKDQVFAVTSVEVCGF